MNNPEVLIVGVLSSILATIVVFLTRAGIIAFMNSLPANKLFDQIVNSKEECIVHQVRLKDLEQKGKFAMPVPDFSSFPSSVPKFEERKLIPWVLSTEDSNASAMVLNTLGKIGRTENIKLAYVDEEYDLWENPMFLIGGSLKVHRVFAKYNTPYVMNGASFVIRETGASFHQQNPHDDLGLLMKTYNTNNNKPIWIAMGMRGAGTAGATYALTKWWKQLGKLYGRESFGMIIQFSDADGWKDATPISYYPEPKKIKRLLHPFAYRKLKSSIKKY